MGLVTSISDDVLASARAIADEIQQEKGAGQVRRPLKTS